MERPPACMKVLNAPPYDVFYTDDRLDAWDTLLCMIVRRDDADALTEYLSTYPYSLKGPAVVQDHQGTVFPDAFEYAATWGATKVLRLLFDYETKHPEQDFRCLGAKGYGLLNLACHHGQLETVRYLLQVSHDVAGDVRLRDGDGWTPLLAAADALADWHKHRRYHHGLDVASYTGQCEEIMALLLDKGAPADDVRERQFWDRGGRFFEIHYRKRWFEGYTEEEAAKIPELIVPPQDPVLICTTHTVLSLAMRRASAMMIKRILDGGADVNVQLTLPVGETRLNTPLHIAARYFNVAAIDVLYDRIGDTEFKKMMKAQDFQGSTALRLATRGARFMLPTDQIVPQGVATFSALLRSCDPGDVDARECSDHSTLLHFALLSSFHISDIPTQHALRARVARLLVEHGANPALKMSDGGNGLHALAHTFPSTSDDQCAEAGLITLFLGRGVSVDDGNNSGDTALHVAARSCPRPAAVRTLLRHGATPEVLNKAGDTPLHVAAVLSTAFRNEDIEFQQAVEMQDEVMRLLVEAASSLGGNPMEKQNASGKTPLEIKNQSREKVKEEITPRYIRGRGWGRGRGR